MMFRFGPEGVLGAFLRDFDLIMHAPWQNSVVIAQRKTVC